MDADINFDLNFTFDLSSLGDPKFIIYDDSQITFKKLVIETLAAIDVKGSFVIGGEEVLSLSINDAEIYVDLTGTISLVEDSTDHKYLMSELASNAGLWNVDLVGTVDANLPMYFPVDDIPFGGSDGDLDGNGFPDHWLHIDGVFNGNNDFEVHYSIPSFDLGSAFDLFKLLNDPQNIIDGLNAMFNTIEDSLTSQLAQSALPFLSTALEDSASFVGELREDVVGRLQNPNQAYDAATNPYLNGVGKALGPGILAGKTTIEILREEIFKGIGDSLSKDSGDGKPYVGLISKADHDDLLGRLESDDAGVRETALAELALRSKDIELVLGDSDIQLNLLIADTIQLLDVPLDFTAAIPGLGFEIVSDTKINVRLDYAFGIGFGFGVSDGIYVDTSGVEATGEEISLQLSATLKNASDPTQAATLSAKLGFVKMALTDVLDTDPLDDGLESGIFGNLEVDLQDAGNDGRWTLLGGSGVESASLEVRLNAFADIDLNGNLELGSGAQFPSVTAVFHYDQLFAEAKLSTSGGFDASFGGPPRIVLEGVSLDLGEFITNFAKPILDKIKVITEPFEPIIKILTTPIPVISDLAPAPVTLLDLAETFGGDKFNRKYIDAAIAVVNVINSLPTDGDSILIGFGDFVIMDGSSGSDLRNPENKMSESVDTAQNDKKYKDSGGLNGQMNNPSGKAAGGAPSSNAPASKKTKGFMNKFGSLEGLEIPLLTSPSAIFGLLAGKETDLFIYRMPQLVAQFEYVKSFPIPALPGLNARLGGVATFTINLGFGFDTSGWNNYQNTNNVVDIFDGFYLTDRDADGVDIPEFTGTLEIFAGASLGLGGIVEAGVEGGLFANIGFNLHDTVTEEFPDGDGKIRGGEIQERLAMGPICLFDTEGDLGVFLRAFLEIKIPLGFTDITIFDEEFELFRATLIEFSHVCVLEAPPAFARLEGTILILNMGMTATGELPTLVWVMTPVMILLTTTRKNPVLSGEKTSEWCWWSRMIRTTCMSTSTTCPTRNWIPVIETAS